MTGDADVDAAIALAAAAGDASPDVALDAYVGAHRTLQERLAGSGE